MLEGFKIKCAFCSKTLTIDPSQSILTWLGLMGWRQFQSAKDIFSCDSHVQPTLIDELNFLLMHCIANQDVIMLELKVDGLRKGTNFTLLNRTGRVGDYNL